MGRINKWITLTLIFFNIGFLLLANEPIIPNQIPRTEKDLENIYVQRLFEGQKDDSALEDYEYYVNTSKKINSFIEKQEKIKTNENSFLLGSWILVSENDVSDIKSNGFFLSNEIQIVDMQNTLRFRDKSSTTYLVKGKDGSIYFKTRWLEGIRQLRFIDSKMYVYILNDDFWELDSIHEGGKYFFIKEDDI
jgi:hypothetical protein